MILDAIFALVFVLFYVTIPFVFAKVMERADHDEQLQLWTRSTHNRF